jgi:selenocysteine-specific elongation factor
VAPLPLTVGTAGHIDHGKTALVRALTGRDTDRLAEEKRRGISIELGFAELDLGPRQLSLIDVPGHERFVRTMIAGASGIDLFLMAVAADEGVMPQTREHAAVLAALGIERGVIALTRSDLADQAQREAAAWAARDLLPELLLVEVSSETGQGLASLLTALGTLAEQVERSGGGAAAIAAVLHIDRVFTVRGRGTVVTGTLWSGTLRAGELVTVLPAGKQARVRELQVHDRRVGSAAPRQRVAINLAGIRKSEVSRGDVICQGPSDVAPTYRLDVDFSSGREQLSDNERVQVHLGTREVPGRAVLLERNLVQLRLEAPLIARRGDRLVARRIAPPGTIGGGAVVDAQPARHRGALRIASDHTAGTQAAATGSQPDRLAADRELASSELARRAMEVLAWDRSMPRGPRALAQALEAEYDEVLAALAALTRAGGLTRIKPDVYYPAVELRALTQRIVTLAQPTGRLRVGELRDALGLTRKYALALLEHLDSSKITVRHGDTHILRRKFARGGIDGG